VQVINDTASVYNNLQFNCTAVKGSVQRYITSAGLNCARLPDDLTPTNNIFTDSIAANTLATYVFMADDGLKLRVAAQAGGVQISYPVWAADIPLLSTTNLAAPGPWVPVTNTGGTNGQIVTIPIVTDNPRQFFRLGSP